MGRTAVRVLLVTVLFAQAWYAIHLTRYERQYQAGELAWNRWDAESALSSFEAARVVSSASADVWRRNGDMALYIHNYPGQVQQDHDPSEMLDHAWTGYVGAVLRCPVDSWSWTGVAEVALNRAKGHDASQGLDLEVLERRSRGVLDPTRAMALAAARVAVELKPAGFQELDTLAAVYESIGDLDRAEATLVESARMVPVPSYHVWGAGRRFGRRLYAAVLAGLEEGIELAPAFERSLLYREVARFSRYQGDYQTAVSKARSSAREAKTPFETYAAQWEMAQSLERLGRNVEAVEAIKIARDNVRDPGNFSHKLGTLELLIGRFEEACVTLRDALRRKPDDDGLRLQTAGACENAGEIELAKRLLEDGFVIPTENLPLSRALIDFLHRNERRILADHLTSEWARDYPDRDEFQRWAQEFKSESP